MTSCLPGADSGGSQGSGLASINDSTMGSGSVNASPVLSPTGEPGGNTNPGGPISSFSATSLASPPTSSAQPPHSLTLSPPAGATGLASDNNNHLSAAAAAAAAGLNLSDCDPARFAGLSYPRLSAAGGLGYSAAAAAMSAATYPSNEQNPYPSIAMADNSFYGPLGNPYAIKDGAAGAPGAAEMNAAWPSAATALQPTGYYTGYDHPSLAAYGYGTGYDLASRRKNATRESTATLKAWLNEHKKNPYPTKGEKIMLAIITKMTLTQVSTWFANARRRLKKENKMTWEPKNKLDDEDVDVSDDDDKDRDDDKNDETDPRHSHLNHMGLHDSSGNDSKSSAGIPIPPSKPKIWSLADTAVCKTPPPTGGGAGGQSHHPPVSHNQQQTAHYQQPPPHSQSYLHSAAAGLGAGTNTAASLTSWGPANFSQFVDPAMMRLRQAHGNMLGMGYMGLPPPPGAGVSQQSFTPLTPSAAAVAAAHVTASPGLNSDGVQSSSNDTPPQTPPTVKNQFGYNGNLHNGYSQMSPSSGPVTTMSSMASMAAGNLAEANASKMLMFNSAMNNASSFKMM